MFEDLARSYQAFEHLLDQDILTKLIAYHNKFFSLSNLSLPADFTNVQKNLQPRCAEVEQKWDQLQKDIQAEMNTIEGRMIALAVEKKLTTRIHWTRRLRCNYDFYRAHRNITLENEDVETIKFELAKHLPQGYYPVALLGLDHRVPDFLRYLSNHSNPFYVADIYNESFELLNRLPDRSKNRTIIRCLGKEDNQVGLDNVFPTEQFGFIMAWNLFNYFTEDVMKEWLEQIGCLLRPGGRVFFTYNNCLDPHNAKCIDLIRNGFTVPSRVAMLSQSAGLDVVEFDHIQSTHWAVLAKPGEFRSIRVAPGVGQIMIKN
jgi:SAM-dependent methyltransferase